MGGMPPLVNVSVIMSEGWRTIYSSTGIGLACGPQRALPSEASKAEQSAS
jgi:hypothetical protein